MLQSNVEFELLPSLSTNKVREIPPIFIIPGFSGKDGIKKLASKLYYPTYIAGLPTVATHLENIATDLTKVKILQRFTF